MFSGPVFLPEATRIVLPKNVTTYQVQCVAPYPVYLKTSGPLMFDISNDTSTIAEVTSLVAKLNPDSLSSANHAQIMVHSSTNVSCMRSETDEVIKSWSVQISGFMTKFKIRELTF